MAAAPPRHHPLIDAALKGDLGSLRGALSEQDVNDVIGSVTALHAAVTAGRELAVEFLLERGADPDQEAALGRGRREVPLEVALRLRHRRCAEILVEHGASTEFLQAGRNGYEYPGLDQAVRLGSLPLLDHFLKDAHGGQLPEAGRPAQFKREARLALFASLPLAARRGDLAMVERLLELGISSSPEAACAAIESLDQKMAERLLPHANPPAPEDAFAALHRAALRLQRTATKDPQVWERFAWMLGLLHALKLKPTLHASHDLLRIACQHAPAPAIARMLELERDPRALLRHSMLPLLVASMGLRADVVALLIEAGADPNDVDLPATLGGLRRLPQFMLPTRRTALHAALQANGPVEDLEATVRVLLAKGASLRTAGIADPFALLPRRRDAAAMRRLIDAGLPIMGSLRLFRALFRPRCSTEWEATREWLRCWPRFILRDNAGGTPLHHAAAGGRPEVVRFLLAQGADPNLQDDAGATPLLRVPMADKRTEALECLRLLLEAGADPNRGCSWWNGQTHQKQVPGPNPLHKAAARGGEKAVRLLLLHGAKPDAAAHPSSVPLDRGMTALGWACTATARRNFGLQSNVAVVKALLDAGADPHRLQGRGVTALELLKEIPPDGPAAEFLEAWMRTHPPRGRNQSEEGGPEAADANESPSFFGRLRRWYESRRNP